MVRRLAIVVASGGLALAAACASLTGLSGGDGTAAPAEAGAEASTSDAAPPPPSDPCVHASYPPPPAKDDAPAEVLPPLVLALRDQSVSGTVDGGAPIGFDLDGVCTCFSDTSTAHGASTSCLPPDGGARACDGDGGVDRQISALLAAYTVPPVTGSGGPTLLLKITKYNGRANDSEVFAGLIASPGIFDPTGCGRVDDAGAAPYPPTWKGCDRFALDEAAVLPGTSEPLSYLPAYVSDHVLVIPPASQPVGFVVGKTTLVVSGALVAVRLTALDAQLQPITPPPDVGQLFRAEGTTGGRVNTTDALRAIAHGQAINDGGPLCGFPNLFNSVKRSFVCPSADITTNASADFTNASCDALSFAAAFAADPAQLGEPQKASKTACADPSDPMFASFFDCGR